MARSPRDGDRAPFGFDRQRAWGEITQLGCPTDAIFGPGIATLASLNRTGDLLITNQSQAGIRGRWRTNRSASAPETLRFSTRARRGVHRNPPRMDGTRSVRPHE